jgi:hypothetical protein
MEVKLIEVRVICAVELNLFQESIFPIINQLYADNNIHHQQGRAPHTAIMMSGPIFKTLFLTNRQNTHNMFSTPQSLSDLNSPFLPVAYLKNAAHGTKPAHLKRSSKKGNDFA